jgi:hypothetical protein
MFAFAIVKTMHMERREHKLWYELYAQKTSFHTTLCSFQIEYCKIWSLRWGLFKKQPQKLVACGYYWNKQIDNRNYSKKNLIQKFNTVYGAKKEKTIKILMRLLWTEWKN